MARSGLHSNIAPGRMATAPHDGPDSVLDGLEPGVLLIGADGRIVLANDGYRALYGLDTAATASGRRAALLPGAAPKRSAGGNSSMRHAADPTCRPASEPPHFGDEREPSERHHLPDGRIVEVIRSPTDDGGTVEMHLDVTASAGEEAAATRADEDRRTLLESIAEGVCLLDAKGNLAAWNDRFLALYGVPPEAARPGMPFAELAGHFADLAALDPDRRQIEIERRFRFATDPAQRGATRQLFTGTTLDIAKAVLPDGRAVLTVRDVTDRLRQSRALEEERRHVEEASRQKSRFLARMSHEMRTPLNGIIGIVALLERTALDPEQRAYAEVIRQSGDVLIRLVDDLLDTARIETEQFQLAEAPFLLGTALTEALATVEPEAREKGIDLELCHGAVTLPPLLGDAIRLKQVLLNLLTNAVKFTEAGSVGLGLDATLEEDAAEVVITVKDTGAGIAPAEQKRIFDHFYQSPGQPSCGFGGIGLGLAISERLVRQMGGRIGLTSEQGRGSTFSVHLRLPFAPPDQPVLNPLV